MSDLRDSLVQSGTLIGYLNTIVYAHNYNDLTNKPQINGVTLQGNKTASEIGLVTPATEAVQSVNGETGAVVLDGDDIAYNISYSVNQKIAAVESAIPAIPVTSVNGETGDVVLDGSDIRYDANYTVSAKIDAVEASIPVVSYPVTSVNSQTGAVMLDGDDIEYSAGVTVNDKIDAVEAAIPVVDYPVTSVAGKTGAVELYASDIMMSDTASGVIATFNTSFALPLQNCEVAINAVQDAGTPTPTDPIAITGFTGANIHVADDETPHVIDNVTAITWQTDAGTVYGGSLDVTSGLLTVTHYGKQITDTSELIDASSGTVGFRVRVEIPSSIIPPADGQTGYDDQKSNVATYIGNAGSIGSNHGTNSFKTHTNGNIYFYLVGYNTLADLKTYAQDMITANTPITFVWKLATPQTYQLTTTQISTIVGTNNVFTDTNGNTSVTFICSLQNYIDRH